MHIDMAGLVQEALVHLGCPQDMGSRLDNHSTITFEFDNLGPLHLSVEDERVWLWTYVGEMHEQVLSLYGVEILTHLMQPKAFLQMEHPVLCLHDGKWLYKGLVSNKYLHSGEEFSQVLDGFLLSITDLSRILNQ